MTSDPQGEHCGFDAAVKRREDDHLNRWPLAREIYGIAVTGPSDWSVRVGIYGEWGTGKTSVLEFIAAMAAKDDHIVIWFDPWEHSTKQDLWRSFVLIVFEELEKKLGGITAAGTARQKAWIEKVKGVALAITGAFNATAGALAESGLDLVKKHFSFSQEDLASLQGLLGERRVIVLIDDLDRTAPELVPEILFALKELMDVPGFSFVSAFDPVVVGKVLRQYHRGFGDGLKFLEKIIDYPRWLPPASPEGLRNLAVAESKRFCPYVPEDALRDALPLLPPNPRAIRQFIRLLALLKPQIERHYDQELHWPVILAANVAKVRHPRMAHDLLKGEKFWRGIDQMSLMTEKSEERNKLSKAIESHIDEVSSTLAISLDATQRGEIRSVLEALCANINRWALRGVKFIAYQMEIAEKPDAVTLKELDQFVEAWTANQTPEAAGEWISAHANRLEFSEESVYRELFEGVINAYAKALREADDTLVETDRGPLEAKVNSLIGLIECLALQLAGLEQEPKRIGVGELTQLYETVASFAGALSPVHARLWPRNEALVLRMVEMWSGDVTPLMNAIHPYDPNRFARRYEDGPAVRAIHQKLCAAVLPRFAKQVMTGFRQAGFSERLIQASAESFNTRSMLLSPSGPLWTGLRSETLAVLNEATTNRIVQENAYELLFWFDYKFRKEQGFQDTENARLLLADKELCDAIWGAATAVPLSTRAASRLQPFAEELGKLNIPVTLPAWWTTISEPSQTESAPEDGSATNA
jgi:hypothetical protein